MHPSVTALIKKPYNMNEKALFITIDNELKSINNELLKLRKSIFFAPELYIGFRISKAIYMNRASIFNSSEEINWQREINLDNGGPSDIVFDYDENKRLVIELKVRDTYNAYEKDIQKLKLLKNDEKQYIRFFCALIDTINREKDGRIQFLTKNYNLNNGFQSEFDTAKQGYTSNIKCNLILIKIT